MNGGAARQGITLLVPLGGAHAASVEPALRALGPTLVARFAALGSVHFARLGVLPGGEQASELVLETAFGGELGGHLTELWSAVEPLFTDLSARSKLPRAVASPAGFVELAGTHARRAAASYFASSSSGAERTPRAREGNGEGNRADLGRELFPVVALTPWFELEERMQRWRSRPAEPRVCPAHWATPELRPFTALFRRRSGRLRGEAFRRVVGSMDSLLGEISRGDRDLGPGGLSALHAARWVELPGHRVLLSALVEGPLGTFFDRLVETVSLPLSLLCMHLEHFPPTRALAFGGARHRDAFRRWLAAHEVDSGVWYCAPGPARATKNIA